MDSNLVNQGAAGTAPTTPPVAQPPAAPPPPVPDGPGQAPPHHNFRLWLIVGAVALSLIIAAGALMYFNNQRSLTEQAQKLTAQIAQDLKDLEKEISSMDLGDIQADLEEIDTDLEQL